MTEAVRPVLIMRPAAESCELGRGHKRIMCNNDKVSTYDDSRRYCEQFERLVAVIWSIPRR